MSRKKNYKALKDVVEAVAQRVDEQQMEVAPEEEARVIQYSYWEPTTEKFGAATMRVLTVSKEIHTLIDLKTFNLKVLLPVSITTGPYGHEEFGEIILKLISEYTPKNATPDTKVGVTFRSPDYDAMSGLVLPFTQHAKVKTDEIVETMKALSKSRNSPLKIQTPILFITLKYITSLRGNGKRKSDIDTENDADSDLDSKRKCQQEDDQNSEKGTTRRSNIMKNDVSEDCFFHAIFQSLMDHQMTFGETEELQKEGKNMCRASEKKSIETPTISKKVYVKVRKLKEMSGMTEEKDCGYAAIQKLQQYFFHRKMQIIVVREFDRDPYFAGPYFGENRTITVLLRYQNGKGHYFGVRSLNSLLHTGFYCCLCLVRSSGSATHYNCPRLHRPCGSPICLESPEDKPVQCEKCKVIFPSETCLKNHSEQGSRGGRSRCDHTKTCGNCKKIYYTNKKDDHNCEKKWCVRCQKKREQQHVCIMPKLFRGTTPTLKRFVYNFVRVVDEETGQHSPIAFVALQYCQHCFSFNPKILDEACGSVCKKCSPQGRCTVIECIQNNNEFTNVAQQATEWIFSEERKGFVGIAHDASGYNAQFILHSLLNIKASPEVVMNRRRIISLKYKEVHLIDSLEYFTTSLESVVKIFDIPMSKRAFPVNFIKRENFNYVGKIPENKWYNLEHRPIDVQEDLFKLLDKERAQKKEFNFVKELLWNRLSNAFILARVLFGFERNFNSNTAVCLFEESVTLPSASLKVFQRTYLDDKKPIVLDVRPSASRNSSVMSQKYLAWFSIVNDVKVASSATTGERKIGQWSVDGFIDRCEKYKNGLIIEFHGCYWHNHFCKYPEHIMIGEKSGREIRDRDKYRLGELKNHHEVMVVWECEVKKQLAGDPAMAKFFDDYEPQDLKEMEKALTGHRIEVFKLKSDNERQSIEHVELASMYAASLMNKDFPIGLPSSVPRENIKTPITRRTQITWNGFITCQVVAPRSLEIPLLAVKIAGKSMYILCRKCAKEKNQRTCQHGEEDRSFKGIFTTVEMERAVELGYVVIQVFDAKEFKDWGKNDDSGKGRLFTSYIKDMLALKTYAGDWPSDIKTNKNFVEECNEHGIILAEGNRFVNNPGLRLTADLLLNSIWGAMTERVDMPQTVLLKNTEEFWKKFNDNSIIIEDVWTVDETIVVLERERGRTMKSLRTGAIHIAAYVASYVRLQLYDTMGKIGPKNICYIDTDSVIYTIPHGEVDPLKMERGRYLGQCTSASSGEVKKFISNGAGSYGYIEQLPNGGTKMKIKTNGILLTSDGGKRTKMEKMEQLVEEVLQEGIPRTTATHPHHPIRQNLLQNVKSERRILKDGTTLPFGYVDK